MNRLETTSQVAVILLCIIATLAVLDVAQNLAAPMVLALVVGVVMSPLSDFVDRAGLPPGMAALGSLLLILLLFLALGLFLEPVIAKAIDAMPLIMVEFNSLIFELRQSLRGIEEATEDVTAALGAAGEAVSGSDANGEETDGGEATTGAIPTVEDALFMAPAILSQFLIFAGVLFFFILTRRDIYAFVAKSFGSLNQQREMAARLKRAERQVARYFLTVAIINSGYAVVVSVVMAAIGMPSPILWGIAAGLLNFILYLGPAVYVVSLVLGGLATFDGLMSFAPAAIYIVMNAVESQFVTPTLVGRQLRTNPLAIFVSLVFFLWLWGVIGGIVAIPLLLWLTAIFSEARDVAKTGRADHAGELDAVVDR